MALDKIPITTELNVPVILVASSSQHTPTASAVWHQHSGNSITLDRDGVWRVKGWVDFGRASVTPYLGTFIKWSAANGDNTGTTPANLSNIIAGVNFINNEAFVSSSAFSSAKIKMVDIYLIVSGGSQTVYLNTRADDSGGNFAQMRISTHIQAEYLGKISLNGAEVGE